MTFEEYARRGGADRNALRAAYTAMMRRGEGLTLPAPAQVLREEDSCKFTLALPGAEAERDECESVLIPMDGYHGTRWRTLCVSVQIGCRMGCTFCETARMGLVRNLAAEEIVLQRLVAREFAEVPERGREAWAHDSDGIRNIVFMGMGESLDNLDEVVRAIAVLSDPKGLAIPHSAMTLSTAGHVPGIRRLGELGWTKMRLAVSLNAANDEMRNELMPINRAWPLAELKAALRAYPLHAKGRFFIEYVLLKGVNDSMIDADAVAAWCDGLPVAINLLSYNPQRDSAYAAPEPDDVIRFMRRLQEHGLFVKRRVSRGRTMMAACGQLGGRNSGK